jgi:hypothetical protein
MTHGRAQGLARVLALVVIALAILYLLVTAVPAMRGGSVFDQVTQVAALWFFVPGAIVVLRRDGHVIGWLLVANGLLWAIQLGSEVAGGGLAWMPLPWRVWITEWIGYAEWSATFGLFVLFPNGLAERPARQRYAGRAMIATALAATIAGMFPTEVGHSFGGSVNGVHPNPTGLGFLPRAVTDFLITPIAVVGLSSIVGLWRRARHVTGAARRQYTWVFFAFAVTITGLVFALATLAVVGEAAAAEAGIDRLVWLPVIAGSFLIPTAFSIAILRHRLYDIDRIVSRTVAYTVITVITAAIYAVPVVALPEVFDLRGPLPVAAATLAAAAAFSPIRRRVQQWVDRHFNRARFDARREIDAFATRLRSQVDLETVVADINALVGSTLQPSTASTWIRPAGQRRLGNTRGS